MVDTLAPKRVFTQKQLNTKLTPISEQVLRTKPRPSLLDDRPKVVGTATSLIDKQSQDFLLDINSMAPKAVTKEQKQTVKSSEETTQEKQTGMRTQVESPQGESLVMRPVEYAANGVKDKEVSGPILVGEKGAELVVPTGEGKVSILDAKTTSGLMMPMKKAEKGMDDINIASAMKSDDAYTDFNITDFLLKDKDSDAQKNLEKFVDVVHNIESSRGRNLNNKSSAAGDFQFKTLTDSNDPTSTKGSAFMTGLQRVENFYNAYDQTVPYWVEEARQHNDPNKLSYSEQKELFLVNLQQQKGTDDLLDKMLEGDIEASKQLYGQFHHTNTKVLNDERVQDIFDRSYFGTKRGTSTGLGAPLRYNVPEGPTKRIIKPVRKAEKGAKNVEIGKAEPVGFFFRNPRTPDKPSGGEKLLNFLFGDTVMPLDEKETPSLLGNPPSMKPALDTSKPPFSDSEPFDPNKLYDPDAYSGINIDYFYNNLDEMVDYSIKLKKGKDYTPTPKEQEEEKKDLMGRYDALFDLQMQDTEDQVEEKNFNERFEMDPNFSVGI